MHFSLSAATTLGSILVALLGWAVLLAFPADSLATPAPRTSPHQRAQTAQTESVPSAARAPFLSSVDVFDAAAYLGDWQLELTAASERQVASLVLAPDANAGEVLTATLRRDNGEALVVRSLRQLGSALVVRFERPTALGPSSEEIVLTAAAPNAAEPAFTAAWRHPEGLYELPLAVSLHSPAVAAAEAAPQAAQSIELFASPDASLVLTGPQLLAPGADYAKLQDIARGEVLTWLGPPLVLRTARALRFGSLDLLPGSYSLWLELDTEGAWQLAVNQRIPKWGTQAQAGGEVGQVSLAYALDGFARGLEAAFDAGQLILRWGESRWSVPVDQRARVQPD